MRLKNKPAAISAAIIIMSAISVLALNSPASASTATRNSVSSIPSASYFSTRAEHTHHMRHLHHLEYLNHHRSYRQAAYTTSYVAPSASGVYSFSGIEHLWEAAGGPSSAAYSMATIAECESGGNPRAYNPSGASGVFQILGAPQGWTGSTDWFNPYVNAQAAVAKFRAGGFGPWVCRG